MRTLIALLLLAITAMPSPAICASLVRFNMNGEGLLRNCQNRSPECLPYIIGVADALEMVSTRLTNICRPAGVTREQLVDVLVVWLEGHPAEWHRPAAKLAGLAYAEAWPCIE